MSRLSLRVLLLRFLWIPALFVSFCLSAQRQKTAVKPRTGSAILDDSTKNVYGPTTTRWTTEKDLFENRPNYQPLDTSINNYHRFTYVQRSNYMLKDLGVFGTALSSLFPQVPSIIGANAGFTAYEPYYNTEEPRYFDTKSPYTRMYIVWGGNGRAMTRIEFSRNINPRWNFGFNYRPILVEKQIQRKQKGDYQTTSHYYDFYTTYKSKDDHYFLLFNYRRIRHRVQENGGVLNDSTKQALFSTDALPRFTGAQTEEYRRNIHLFHQYTLAKPLQIYHIADLTKQTNGFTDDYTKDLKKLFDNTYKIGTDTTKANDQTMLITMQQEVGIKGNIGKLFYSGHYKFRSYDYSSVYLQPYYYLPVKVSGSENYLGGTMSLKVDSLVAVAGAAEYMLDGFYHVEGRIQSPWIEGYFKNSLAKPGFMQQVYYGSHDFWAHSYAGVSSTQAQGFLKLNTDLVKLWAGGTFTLLHNYVYFKEDTANVQTVLPYQSPDIMTVVSPEAKAEIKILRHMFFRPQVISTTILNDNHNALRIPDLFVNAQFTYENNLFRNHLQLQTGVEVHWQSTYDPLAYDPAIQQFYVQQPRKGVTDESKNVSTNQAYALADIFFNGKMRRARFFFKYHNLVQTFTGIGYIPTRGYPGQRSVLDFGFEFLLFD